MSVWKVGVLKASMARAVSQCIGNVLNVFNSRFVLHKDAFSFTVIHDEEVDSLWGFLTLVLWGICIYMRNYDTILRGCSPIAMETVILLLRVMFLEDDVVMRRGEVVSSQCGGGGSAHRAHSTLGVGVRGGAVQQKSRERIGPRTAFELELFVWFVLIFCMMDPTSVNRLAVALFLVNTLHWIRFGPKSAMFCVGVFVFVTHSFFPAYSLRDTFLTLSGQRSWIYKIYSSFSLAFSLTLILTTTQTLQHARQTVLWWALMNPRIHQKKVTNTRVKGLFAGIHHVMDSLYFVGFNFCLALSLWFSTMMIEWSADVSFAELICAVCTIIVVTGGEWIDIFRKAFRENIICIGMYLMFFGLIFFSIPTGSLPFISSGISSAFFVLYIAGHSPRRVRSSFPLLLVWLGMMVVSAYWNTNCIGVSALRMPLYKKLFCINTITLGSILLSSTAVHVYRCEWPVHASSSVSSSSSTASSAVCVGANGSTKSSSSTRLEYRLKEKSVNGSTTNFASVEKAASSSGGRWASSAAEKGGETCCCLSSSASSISRPVENVNLERPSKVEMSNVETDKCNETEACKEERTVKPSLHHDEKNAMPMPDDTDAISHSTLYASESELYTRLPSTEREENEDILTLKEEEENENEACVENTTEEEAVDLVVGTAHGEDDDTKQPSQLNVSEKVTAGTPLSEKKKQEEEGKEQKKDNKKEEVVVVADKKKQKESIVKQTSRASLLSQSRSKNVEESVTSPLYFSDDPCRIEHSSRSFTLTSPLRTNSSVSSGDQRGETGKGKKTPGRFSAAEEGNTRVTKNNGRAAAVEVGKKQVAEKAPSLQARESVMPIPLPRCRQESATRVPTVESSASTASKLSGKTSSFAAHRAAVEAVTGYSKGNVTHSNNRKEAVTATDRQSIMQPSGEKGESSEVTENKRQPARKGTTHGNASATDSKPNNELLSSSSSAPNKRSENRSSKTEAPATTKATTNTTSTPRLGPAQRNNDNNNNNNNNSVNNNNQQQQKQPQSQGTSTASGETSSVAIPQPRSAQTLMKGATPRPLTEAAVRKVLEEKTELRRPKPTKCGEKEEKALHAWANKCSSDVSSHGDDDVSLDLAQLHLASLPESDAEKELSQQQNLAPPVKSSPSIPQSTLHSLANFAKAYKPQSATTGITEMNLQADKVTKKEVESSLSMMNSPTRGVSQTTLLEAVASSGTLGHAAPAFTEAQCGVSHNVPTQVFSTGNVCETNKPPLYQHAASSFPGHTTLPNQIETQSLVIPQGQVQQQIPCLLVAVGNGYYAYCPVVTTAAPYQGPLAQRQPPPQEQQPPPLLPPPLPRGLVHQHPFPHLQQAYAEAWVHLNKSPNPL